MAGAFSNAGGLFQKAELTEHLHAYQAQAGEDLGVAWVSESKAVKVGLS